MGHFRRLIQYLWPEAALEGSPWLQAWQAAERDRFVKIARIFFAAAALGYLAHYFFFDIPNNLEPRSAWLTFRLSAAGLCVLCLIYYGTRLTHWRYFRVPAIVVMALGCHAQAQVTYFYPEAPWIYPFAFVFGGVLILQMSPLKSLFFSVPVSISCFPPLLNANVDFNSLLSAAFFFCLVSSVSRTAHTFEIQAFLRENERDESRREVIRLGKDFEARLKSFIPRVIADRIESMIDTQKMSPLNATIDVLRPRRQQVSCLFSDIRGFTKGSRDVDGFLLESVIPEVKACSDVVESRHGIPRKIGDLIFAYFDDANSAINVLRAVLAGYELSALNQDLNESAAVVEVRRFILISVGEAIVGNVGGMNSGVEITALGSPVNFLSRLDDATKEPGIAAQLEPGDLILSKEAADGISNLGLEVAIKRVDLNKVGAVIRDFPDVECVYIIRPSQRDFDLLQKHYLHELEPAHVSTESR